MNCDLFICTICQDWLFSRSDIVIINCGHLFHSSCLMRWINSSSSCPTCRFAVSNDTITPVYFDEEGVNQDHQLDVGSLRAAYSSLRQEASLKEEVLTELMSSNNALEAEVGVCRKKIEEHEKLIDETKKQICGLKTLNDSFVKEKQTHTFNMLTLKGLNTSLQEKCDNLTAELKKLISAKELLEKKNSELNNDQKSLQPDVLDLCLSSLKKDLPATSKSERVLIDKLNKIHAKLEKIQKENDVMKGDIQRDREAIGSLLGKHASLIPPRVSQNDVTAIPGPSTSNHENMSSSSAMPIDKKRKPVECSIQQEMTNEPKRKTRKQN